MYVGCEGGVNEMTIFYQCDPEKNVECKKKMCFMNTMLKNWKNPCRLTQNPSYAKVDEKTGRPLVGYVRLDDNPKVDGGMD